MTKPMREACKISMQGVKKFVRPPPPPPSLLPFRYDAGYGAERAQRERPGHRVVRVEHREDPLEELVHHRDLVEVPLTLKCMILRYSIPGSTISPVS